MKRLEIEVRRLLEMYKKKQRENEILQFQVSCLIGNAKVEDFYKVFPPMYVLFSLKSGKFVLILHSFDVASLYQTPESLGKDLDQLMATYEDPEAGNKEERQALFEHAVKALRRDRANQAAARLVLAAVKAEVEGVEIGQSDVEAVLTWYG
ncbi:hypothetical protein N7470_002749 [Penicillium chermesinum]|nr:hypothetical protein N7470_002749 [Penicillium chermesinum]